MSVLISVIVPIYNGEAFLAETIVSVLNQTYKNWELLLIDDGSDDNSSSICNAFVAKDDRIKYHYKENGGQASARNLGIKLSKGSWVALLDADDVWDALKLEKQVNALKKHPTVEFCYTNTSAFKNDLTNEVENKDQYHYGLSPTRKLFSIVFSENFISNSSALFKKSVLDKVGLYDEAEQVRGTEDWDLLLRVLKNESYAYGLKDKLIFYRLHEGGIHNQSIRMLTGKAIVYSRYENSEIIPRLLKLKQYRYVYRELLNALWEENKTDLIKNRFAEFAKKDRYGIGTLKQRLLITILPLKYFMWISQKVIYRIAYRLEKVSYFLFLK